MPIRLNLSEASKYVAKHKAEFSAPCLLCDRYTRIGEDIYLIVPVLHRGEWDEWFGPYEEVWVCCKCGIKYDSDEEQILDAISRIGKS